MICLCSGGNLKESADSSEPPPLPYSNNYILHTPDYASCNCVWTQNCTCAPEWRWVTVKHISHFLPQLTQSPAGRWNVYGKGCKTTVGVIRKDKRENAVNGPRHVCRGGTSDSWWQKWTHSTVGGHIRSDHIKYSKRILFYVPSRLKCHLHHKLWIWTLNRK